MAGTQCTLLQTGRTIGKAKAFALFSFWHQRPHQWWLSHSLYCQGWWSSTIFILLNLVYSGFMKRPVRLPMHFMLFTERCAFRYCVNGIWKFKVLRKWIYLNEVNAMHINLIYMYKCVIPVLSIFYRCIESFYSMHALWTFVNHISAGEIFGSCATVNFEKKICAKTIRLTMQFFDKCVILGTKSIILYIF